MTIVHEGVTHARASTSSVGVGHPEVGGPNRLLLAVVVALRSVVAPGEFSAPAGWAMAGEVGVTAGSTRARFGVFRRLADDASPPSTFSAQGAAAMWVAVHAYANVDGADPIDALAFGGGPAPSVTTTGEDARVLIGVVRLPASVGPLTAPAGTTERLVAEDPNLTTVHADFAQVAPGATEPHSFAGSAGSLSQAFTVALRAGNYPPYAPTNLTPDGVTVDRTTTQRLAWQFSDPDPGDTQSQAEVCWRQGSGTWTTIPVGTTQWVDVPGGTWADGQVEWQVRTRDNAGEWGPWSSSAFFTASTPPPGSTITSPTNGGTISTEQWLVTWTVGDQDAYQLQVLDASDDSVLYDTGTVESSGARSRMVDFPTNGLAVKVQHRARTGGLWQLEWSTIAATVDWTAPAAPTVTVAIHHEWDPIARRSQPAAIAMYATHPTPEGDQPQVVAVDWWRRRELLDHAGQHVGWDEAEGGEAGIPLARGHQRPASAVFVDWQVAHGQPYAYRARAHGDNETSSWSDWTAAEGEITFPYGGTYDVDA